MQHIVTTPPDEEPVTLAQMRQHLGITQSTDTARDAIITGRIISARQWAEQYTRTAYVTQTLTGYSDDFHGQRIDLKAPLQSVSSILYLDANGVQQTLSTSDYLVDAVANCVVPAYGLDWPDARLQRNSIQIAYLSGYGDPDDVPESIKDAIRFIVGQWEVFQASMEGVMRPFTIPNAAKQLLEPYVDMRGFY
jgi:uncharacterized phiE125 gp8 family phage protein